MPTSANPEIRYALDTSAILAYFLNEPQAPRVASLHRQSAIPFIAPSELYAVVWLKFGQPKADEVVAHLREWSLPWLWPREDVVFLAGRWRALHHLGLADSFIAALAFTYHATLVTKDSDFRVLEADLKLLWL